MAISASRFKFLNEETNTPITDFLKVTDSSSINAVVGNTVVDAVATVNTPTFSLEDTVKEGVLAFKDALNTDGKVGEFIKDVGKEVSEYIPDGMGLNVTGMLDNFKGAFNKVSNLSSSSLCSLINAALGMSIVDLLLNLSPDMRKRLFMMALLALMHRLCYNKFNEFDNVSNLISKNDVKDMSKKVLDNLVKGNTIPAIDKFLPRGSNPVMRAVNELKRVPNPYPRTPSITINPRLTAFA